MDIKQYQDNAKREYYEYVKNAILSNIKLNIKNDPNINSINYYHNSSFLVHEKGKLVEPIWIYNKINIWFDRLLEDLKTEGINLRKVEVYENKRKGLFNRKTTKEFVYDYYNLSW